MKLKPYPKYRDSGIKWIGEIPEGWEVRKLKQVTSIMISNVDKKSKPNEEEVLICNYNEVYNNEFITSNLNFMKATASIEQINKFSIKKEDVIITKDSETPEDIAVPSLVEENLNKIVCGYHLAVIRPNNSKIEGKFLLRLFQSRKINNQFVISAKGVTRFGISTYPIKNSFVVVPPKQIQTAIANFLDSKTAEIDALIEKDKKLIELLKEKRTALINHAVTKGLDPNVKLKDSRIEGIGEIPEGWEVVPLKKYLETSVDYRGATPEKTNEGIFLVTGKNIKGGKIDYELSKEYVFEDQYEEVMHRGKPKIGDLLFTTEAPLGEVANVDYEKIALAQRIIKIRGKKQKLDNYYLKYYIMTQLFQSHLQSLATGSTALGLKASNWCFLRLIVPPLPEQLQIVQYLDKASAKIDKTIKHLEKKIKLLEEYKKSLIHQVVTGKVDVRGVEA